MRHFAVSLAIGLVGGILVSPAAAQFGPVRTTTREEPAVMEGPPVAEELQRPAKLIVARTSPQAVAPNIGWTHLPRYISEGTYYRPTDNATADLEIEVEEGGVFVVAFLGPSGKISEGQRKTLTTTEQWDNWGFHYAGRAHRIAGERLDNHYLRWCAAETGSNYKIRTHLKNPPVVFVPAANYVESLIGPKRENPLTQRDYVEYIYPQQWDLEPVDCLKTTAELAGYSASGMWTFEAGSLKSDSANSKSKLHAIRFPIYGRVPSEYDLELVATRLRGDSPLQVGLVSDETQGVLSLGGNGAGSGLEQLADRKEEENFVPGDVFENGRPAWIHVEVRVSGIKATVDGKVVVDFRGDIRRLGASKQWADLKVHRDLFLMFDDADFQFDRVVWLPMRSGPDVRRWRAEQKSIYRKWTFREGNGLADHVLKSFQSNEVVLESRDGGRVSHNLLDLHSLDQRFIRRMSGEGPTDGDLSPEVLERVANATVYIRSVANSNRLSRSVGFLFSTDGDVGYVATQRNSLLYSGDMQVYFNYGSESQRVAQAERIFQGLTDPPNEDFVVLKIRMDDLPAPIEISRSATPAAEDVAYCITFPDYLKPLGDLPPEDRRIVVQKKPISRVYFHVFGSVASFTLQSAVDGAPGGVLVDREGRLLGMGNRARTGGTSGLYMNWVLTRGVARTYARLLEKSDAPGKGFVWGNWVNSAALPGKATLLVAERDRDEPIVKSSVRERVVRDAKEFPMRAQGHFLGGHVELDPSKAYTFQWQFEDGDQSFYSPAFYNDFATAPPWHTYLGGVPSVPVKLDEPEGADAESPAPTDANESAVETVLPYEDGTAIALNLTPTGRRPSMLWTRDARGLTVLEKNGRLCQLSLPDFRVTRQLILPCENAGPVALSKEGLVVLMPKQQQLWVLDESSLQVIRRVHVPGASKFATTPASSLAYVIGDPTELFTVDLAAGKLLRLHVDASFIQQWFEPMRDEPQPPYEFRSVAVTADGRYLLTNDELRISRFGIQGDGQLLYEDSTPMLAYEPRQLAVSPDGQRVALTTFPGNSQIHNHPVAPWSWYVFDVDRLHKPLHMVSNGSDALAFHSNGKLTYGHNNEYHPDLFIPLFDCSPGDLAG